MAFETFVEWRRNGKRCMYLMCDFNGKWFKALRFFFMCCTFILLASVESKTIGDYISKSAPPQHGSLHYF